MPLRCLKCDADVTIAYFSSPPHLVFRCECGSGEFIEQPEIPKKPWRLSYNDRQFLRSVRITPE